MKTMFGFFLKTDSEREIIGRVMATSLYEARELFMQIKRLDSDRFDALFSIIPIH